MAKSVVISLNTPYSDIRELYYSGKYKYARIKNTDAVMLLTDANLPVYSAKMKLYGNRTTNLDLHNFLMNKDYVCYWRAYDSCEWGYVVRKLQGIKFTKGDYEKTLTLFKDCRCFEEQKYPEYGVELEVESAEDMSVENKRLIADKGGKLIQDVGYDGSVRGTTEIRFNHPRLSGWKYKDVSELLNYCKELGGTNEFGSAGMHIHISRKDIKAIIKKFADNLNTMQEILYPINCRKLKKADGDLMYYGVNGNIYHNQADSFGTLEIRAWNSTLDPKLFLARIKFCKTLTNWLAETATVSIESFFNFMSKGEKANYKYMLNHPENPHEWGFPPKAINALLA